LTGDQHTDHIENGQRVSRHSLPTLLCFNFSQRTNILKFYANPQTAHLQAAQANAQPKLAKEPFFANAPTNKLTII